MKTYTQRSGRIKARLEDWALWRRYHLSRQGWKNINAAYFDSLSHVQRRNDKHSDPVLTEVSHTTHKEKRDEATERAYRELIPQLQDLIYARYIGYPDLSDTALARKIGIDRKLIKNNLDIAHQFLDRTVSALSSERMQRK